MREVDLRAAGDLLYELVRTSVRHHRAVVLGVGTHWLTAGDRSGPPLLLLHSAGSAAALWYTVLPALAPYRVMAADMPGHGESESPGWDSVELLPRLRDWLAELVEALTATAGQPPVLVAHAFGGYLALLLEMARPGALAGLALVNSAGLTPMPAPWMGRLSAPVLGEIVFRVLPLSARALERSVRRIAPLAASVPHVREALAYHYLCARRPGFRRFYLAMVRSVNRYREAPEYQTRPRLEQLRLPVMIVSSPHDIFPLERARKAAQRIAGADLLVLEGAGHLAYLERAQEFHSALTKWLLRTSPKVAM